MAAYKIEMEEYTKALLHLLLALISLDRSLCVSVMRFNVGFN
jgi:hypothetical protein